MKERNGWEHYELEKEMAGANMATLLELFKRESKAYTEQCIEYVNLMSKVTEEGKKELEEACQLKLEGRQKIAMKIAEMLTDTKLRIYHN